MKINGIEIYHVRMPLIYPFRTSFSNEESIESVFVKISSGKVYGWGEAAPWRLPAYSGECASGVFLVIKDFLGPAILGKDLDSGVKLQEEMNFLKDNYFAKSALDLAWWDLKAKMEEKPLWKLIGGKKNPVDVGADFGVMETIPALLDTVDEALQ